MNSSIKHLIATMAAVALAASSYAFPTLTISDGIGDTVSFSAGDATVTYTGNVAPTGFSDTLGSGQLSWSGVIGTGGNAWHGVFDIADTWPLLGTSSNPQMDVNINGTTGVGTLKVDFTAAFTGVAVPASLTQQIGINNNAAGLSVVGNGYQGATLITTVGPLVGLTTGSDNGGLSSATDYTLTDEVILTSTQAGSRISVDSSLQVPDGATTVVLLGLGLLGLSAASRRAKMAKV